MQTQVHMAVQREVQTRFSLCSPSLHLFCHLQKLGLARQAPWENDIINIQVDTCCTEESPPLATRMQTHTHAHTTRTLSAQAQT